MAKSGRDVKQRLFKIEKRTLVWHEHYIQAEYTLNNQLAGTGLARVLTSHLLPMQTSPILEPAENLQQGKSRSKLTCVLYSDLMDVSNSAPLGPISCQSYYSYYQICIWNITREALIGEWCGWGKALAMLSASAFACTYSFQKKSKDLNVSPAPSPYT